MRRRSPASHLAPPDVLTLVAATWLVAGVALLGLTPLPLHDPHWGWSLPFWLLVAPALLLCVRHVLMRQSSGVRHARPVVARRRRLADARMQSAGRRARSARALPMTRAFRAPR